MIATDRGLSSLFAGTLFLSAGLLFAVQPMAARMVLPVLGGSPSVWLTCLLFFQAGLLLGYVYAHAITSRLGINAQVAVHLSLFLLAALALPIDLSGEQPAGPPPTTDPRFWLLGRLTMRLGPPFVLLAATAPLLQRWFSLTGHRRSANPYPLYVASNLGSLLALLLYPTAIEPQWTLSRQSHAWGVGYGGLGLALLLCSWSLTRAQFDPTRVKPDEDRYGVPTLWRTWAFWVVLAFLPSSLMLGVTLFITTDIASVPLLWVIPLALYLLTFIISFARRPLCKAERVASAFVVLVLMLVPILVAGWTWSLWIPLHLGTFFAASWMCHATLAENRPPASRLTGFYLALALGGVLGGVFNALIAPLLFDRVVEYPLALFLTCLMVPWGRASSLSWRTLRRAAILPVCVLSALGLVALNPSGLAESGLGVLLVMVGTGLAALVASRARREPLRFALGVGAVLLAGGLWTGVRGTVLRRERNFFGVVTVTRDDAGRFHRLFHGSTLHGQQSLDPIHRREPLTYFHRAGPFGAIVQAYEARPSSPRIAVVGLGAGSMAAYARPGQSWTFYELDPALARIARDPTLFTYLNDCQADRLEVRIGDARLNLRGAPQAAFGLIVLDAFSSDAPPVHLLTREAFQLYAEKLASGGLIGVNITNRFLDLEPVVAALADENGWSSRVRYDLALSQAEREAGRQPSVWVALARQGGDLQPIASGQSWRPLRRDPTITAWTDDDSDLVRPFLRRLRGIP